MDDRQPLHPNLAQLVAARDEILDRRARGLLDGSEARRQIMAIVARDDQGVMWMLNPDDVVGEAFRGSRPTCRALKQREPHYLMESQCTAGEIMAASSRTAQRALIGLLAAISFALVGCGSAADGADPATAPYDDCAGHSSGPGAMVGFDTSTGELRWSRLIGSHAGNSFAAEGTLLKIGTDGNAVAYDAATGVARWCRPGEPSSTATPWPTAAAAEGDTVVLHTTAGELTALDLETGTPRWTTPLAMGRNPRLHIIDGTVVALDATRTATFVGQPEDTTDTVLGVYDLATGRPLDHPAEIQAYDDISTGQQSVPAGLEMVAHGISGSEPYSLPITVRDHSTGEVLWSRTMHAVYAFLDRDIVFVVDQPGPLSPGDAHDIDTTLIALRATDGVELWRTSIHAAAPRPEVAGDLLLWTVGSQIKAFNRANGAALWTADHGSPGRGGDASEPGNYGGFAVSKDGTVTAGYIYAEPPYRD